MQTTDFYCQGSAPTGRFLRLRPATPGRAAAPRLLAGCYSRIAIEPAPCSLPE
jgi:hypothetical protein